MREKGKGVRRVGGWGGDRQRNRQVSAQALSKLPFSDLPLKKCPISSKRGLFHGKGASLPPTKPVDTLLAPRLLAPRPPLLVGFSGKTRPDPTTPRTAPAQSLLARPLYLEKKKPPFRRKRLLTGQGLQCGRAQKP